MAPIAAMHRVSRQRRSRLRTAVKGCTAETLLAAGRSNRSQPSDKLCGGELEDRVPATLGA